MRQFGLLLCLVVGAACSPAGPVSSSEGRLYPLTVGGHPLQVELAITPDEQSRGLMFRKELPNDHGMLFIFESPRQASFWMKNTLIPLSIAYLDAQGTILEMYRMNPLDETSITSRSRSVAFALEVNQGWFEKNQIQPGDVVSPLPNTGLK